MSLRCILSSLAIALLVAGGGGDLQAKVAKKSAKAKKKSTAKQQAKKKAKLEGRFHIVTKGLQNKLVQRQPQLQTNINAVAQYKRKNGRTGGSVFLVKKADKNGYALALTNHHVALFEKTRARGDQILFHVGGADAAPIKATVAGVVAADKALDYALVRIKMPKELVDMPAVRLSSHIPDHGAQIYNTGFPRIWSIEKQRLQTTGPDGKPMRGHVSNASHSKSLYKHAKDLKTTPKTIQQGKIDHDFSFNQFIGMKIPVVSGQSGSPVFSSQSNKVLGMLGSGGGTDLGFFVPSTTILRHVKSKLGRIKHEPTRKATEELLRTVEL